jgi:hypothetical protein
METRTARGLLMETHWIALQGTATVDGSNIFYSPRQREATDGQAPYWTQLRASTEFQQGTVSFKVRIGGAQPIEPPVEPWVRLGLGGPVQPVHVGFRAVLGANFGITRWNGSEWVTLGVSGFGETLPSEKEMLCTVKVMGSRIDMIVDGVEVCTAYSFIPKSQIEFSFGGTSNIEVSDIMIEARRPKAFVVMQFGPGFDEVYREVIKPTCERFGFEVVRSDDIYSNGLILLDIVSSIQEASLVIADITPNNANVFYEVGFAHGISKPTILLSNKTRDNLPFDVAGMRTLFYDNTIAGKAQIEQKLEKHLEALATSPVLLPRSA